MTVQELRNTLADLDDDLEVVVDLFGKVDVPVIAAELSFDNGDESTGHIQLVLEQ